MQVQIDVGTSLRHPGAHYGRRTSEEYKGLEGRWRMKGWKESKGEKQGGRQREQAGVQKEAEYK